MRMWMIPPHLLCRSHLLGEHGEVHKHRHNFVKHHRVNGRMSPIVQIEPASMGKRHDALVAEMLERGYNHNSPYEMPDISYLPLKYQTVKVDLKESYAQLLGCPNCVQRFLQFNLNLEEIA